MENCPVCGTRHRKYPHSCYTRTANHDGYLALAGKSPEDPERSPYHKRLQAIENYVKRVFGVERKEGT